MKKDGSRSGYNVIMCSGPIRSRLGSSGVLFLCTYTLYQPSSVFLSTMTR